MPRCLLFQLFAPLASWGDIAVGERRPSLPHPTKSAVLGLVAGSLGYRRTDDGLHAALHRRFELGVRIDAPGTLLIDYHTTQTASGPELRKARKLRPIVSRADLLRHCGELHTILSTRDYYCDTLAIVALLDRDPSEAPSLDEISAALDRPCFAPYLGRRAASPALPLAPQIVDASSLLQALRAFSASEHYSMIAARLGRSRRNRRRTYLWEGERDGAAATVTRRDGLLHRSRWQFTERSFHRLDEEVGDVSLPI